MMTETINERLDQLNPVHCQICKTRLYRATNPKLVCVNDECRHENLGPEAKLIASSPTSNE